MADLKEKIMNILKKHSLMSFATLTEDNRPWVRYVTGSVFDDMRIVFATFKNSRKAKQVEKNPEVHITCGITDPEKDQEYLQVAGKAKISTDSKLRLLYWSEGLKNYFKGPDDPNYCLCIITPYLIELNTMESPKPLVWKAE